MKQSNKLTDSHIWKLANEIAEHVYGKLVELEEFPDEKWNTERKLRDSANDVIFFTAQAVGNSIPAAAEYDWNSARKHLSALRAMYIFAHKQKFIVLSPEVVVKIDDLLKRIDQELATTQTAIKAKDKQELEPWLEKYRLWQQMQK